MLNYGIRDGTRGRGNPFGSLGRIIGEKLFWGQYQAIHPVQLTFAEGDGGEVKPLLHLLVMLIQS